MGQALSKRLKIFCRCMMTMLCLTGLKVPSAAASSSLCVTNFGARGDAFDTLAKTVQGSALIQLLPTNQLSPADVGKLVMIFGAGAPSTPTNHQDLMAQILSVNQGTNITLSVAAGITGSQLPVTC